MKHKLGLYHVAAFAMAASLLSLQAVHATSIADRSLSDLYRTASWLVFGAVESESAECRTEYCVYRVRFDVKENIKGSLDTSELEFCSLNPLGARSSYYIFVVPGASVETFGIECDRVLLVDGVIKKYQSGDYYRYMSPNADGNLVRSEGTAYRTAEIEEPRFAEMLKKWRGKSMKTEGINP